GTADSVAFRPLAIDQPDRLVALYGTQGEAKLLNVSYPTFSDLRRDVPAFRDAAAVNEGAVTLSDGQPETIWAANVSDNYFTVLGVAPELGSLIRQGQAPPPIVVLSHALWVTRFARSPAVIGQQLRINNSAFTIVGVAPEQFTGTKLFTYEPRV